MSSDVFAIDSNKTCSRLLKAVGIVQSKEQDLKVSEGELSVALNSLASLESRLDVSTVSVEAVRAMMTQMSAEGIKALEKMLQDALNIVFFDREYRVEILSEDKRGVKTLDFYLIEGEGDSEVTSNIRDSVGGSIRSVVSLITQIFYISQNGAEPIIFLDEAFSDIRKSYFDSLFQLLQVFRDKMGFAYFLITHMDEVLMYADKVYALKDGVVKEVTK